MGQRLRMPQPGWRRGAPDLLLPGPNSQKPKASRMIDLPAPVSPVSTVSPGPMDRSRASINMTSRIQSPISMSGKIARNQRLQNDRCEAVDHFLFSLPTGNYPVDVPDTKYSVSVTRMRFPSVSSVAAAWMNDGGAYADDASAACGLSGECFNTLHAVALGAKVPPSQTVETLVAEAF